MPNTVCPVYKWRRGGQKRPVLSYGDAQLFAQFNQLTLRVLIVRIQLDRPRICHTRILDIVRRLVTISKAVPRIRGIGISLCVQFEQHDG